MIEYIHEPTDLQCGQAVLAMVLGKTVEEIVIFLQSTVYKGLHRVTV